VDVRRRFTCGRPAGWFPGRRAMMRLR
jgi:hypothetical protein